MDTAASHPDLSASPAPLAQAARAALVVAAARRSSLTHGELARALDLDGEGPPAERVRAVLESVAAECARREEPRLDALVVDGESGRPGPGWGADDGVWPREVVRCHRWWSER